MPAPDVRSEPPSLAPAPAAGPAAGEAAPLARERWEFGSFFHLPPQQLAARALALPWAPGTALYASGRDALRALLAAGRRLHGWQRAWLPEYFCQEVVESLGAEGLALCAYPDDPTRRFTPPAGLAAQDVLLYVNYFGVRTQGPGAALPCAVIEDHTHDPWGAAARGSRAAYGLVSLRKTLPVPVGSALWSPQGLPLPPVPQVTPERLHASALKLAAMALKARFLAGGPVTKDSFRALAAEGEAQVAGGPVSAAPPWVEELLAAFPTAAWREARAHNARALRGLLGGGGPGFELLPAGPGGTVEFCVPLLFAHAGARDRLRERLAQARIYLPVLWPLAHPLLPGVSERARSLSARLLCLPCDWRYGPSDLARVADALLQAAGAAA